MLIPKPYKIMQMGLEEKLAILGLMEEGLRTKQSSLERLQKFFDNLERLINKTISGSKISLIKDFSQANAFHTIEVLSEEGKQLARLHMLYLKKPIQCYYLVYVEVQYPFRKKGLGTRVINFFNEFLEDKVAVGILDNVIPRDDPTYTIYLNNGWTPITEFISSDLIAEGGDYMVYVPTKLQIIDLKDKLNRVVYHIKRKKTYIHMRENESMVKKTISEFIDVYNALCIYFEDELKSNTHTPLMRYLFTKYTTKLISFKRRISELVGYTGGESLEQIRISEHVRNIPVQSYTPRGMTERPDLIYGDVKLYNKMPGSLRRQPARFIEALPNYRRPSFVVWLTKKGYGADKKLTIGDLLELGFDPTRLKEFSEENEKYIFERLQLRLVDALLQKTGKLLELKERLKNTSIFGTLLEVNPPLLILKDGGNAYVLRRKIEGIHWDEAMEQLQANPSFVQYMPHVNLEGILKKSLNKLHSEVELMLGMELPFDFFTYFVSWNLRTNQPKVVVEYDKSFFERLWIA